MLSLAVLAGGKSTRMGSDKARMPFLGHPLIERVIDRVSVLSKDIYVITDQTEDFHFLGLPLIKDILPGCGPLGGLFTALSSAAEDLVAVVGCDMPFVNPAILHYASDVLSREAFDAALPSTPKGLEPLHAVYRKSRCLESLHSDLKAGERKMSRWLQGMRVRYLSREVCRAFDPEGLAFWNVNSPEEFTRAEAHAREHKH